MLKKIILLCVVSVSLHVVLPDIQLKAAQAPAQKDGVFMSVVKDLVWLGGKIGQGCASGARGLYNLWCAHMTKNRFYAMVGIPAAVAGGYALYNYYQVIVPIEKKYEDKFIIINGSRMPRFSNWKNNTYKTSADILEHKAMANTDLDTDIKNSHEKEYGRYTIDDVDRTIKQEKIEIDQEVQQLENEFLVYFTFLPSIFFKKEYGLWASYASRQQPNTKEDDRIPDNDMKWTKKQFATVDAIMEMECRNAAWHYICKINYGPAAKCWWKLKKRHMKLRALEEIVEHVKADNSRPAPIDQGISQTEHGHAVAVYHNE